MPVGSAVRTGCRAPKTVRTADPAIDMNVENILALLKPGLFGGLVLVIGAISGWGMTQAPDFVLTRMMRWWVLKVLVPVLKRPSWLLRSIAIFVNNAGICMLLVASGRVALLPWFAIAGVGVAMGAALRVLVMAFGWQGDAIGVDVDKVDAEKTAGLGGDHVPVIGMLLNMLELPAIVLTLALALVQSELPITQSIAMDGPILVWPIMLMWTLPMLALAACGESLWMGRQQVFDR